MTKNPEISEYVIAAVPFNMVDVLWDKIEPHLHRVVNVAHGEITCDSVKTRLKSGSAVLVTISKGTEVVAVNTLEVRVMDSGLRTLFIPIVGGDELDGWINEFLKIAKAIARDYKCTELRGLAARKGWMRKLEQSGECNWENVHMVVRCPVEDEIGE